jgi:hypothetical protein
MAAGKSAPALQVEAEEDKQLFRDGGDGLDTAMWMLEDEPDSDASDGVYSRASIVAKAQVCCAKLETMTIFRCVQALIKRPDSGTVVRPSAAERFSYTVSPTGSLADRLDEYLQAALSHVRKEFMLFLFQVSFLGASVREWGATEFLEMVF